MRRSLVVALLSFNLFVAVPRDGGWFEHFRIFVYRAIHHVVSMGDGITPPKP